LNLACLPGRIVKRGRRITATATTTTILGVLRVDSIAVVAGRAYGIHTSGLAIDGATAAAIGRAEVRHTTDGSVPGTGSALLPGAWTRDQTSNTIDGTIQAINGFYFPSTSHTLRILLCIASGAGAVAVQILGDATFPIDLVVTDMGEDPGDSGVDI